MSKIIATYNSHQSNTQPAPLCPTSKWESARKSHRSQTLGDPMDCSSARLLCPWDSSGENTGVGRHFLPQGVFPTQDTNLGLSHCRRTLYRLSHQEACPISGASQVARALGEWGAGFPTVGPSSPPTSQGGSPSLCWIPWLGHPICGLNCSLPRAGFQLSNLSFLLTLLPEAQIPAWSPLFPYFTIHVNLYYSLCCPEIFLPVSSSFSVRTAQHVAVFLMCSSRGK